MNKMKMIVITGLVLIVIGVVGTFVTYQFMDRTPMLKTESVAGEKIFNVKIISNNEHVTIIPVKDTTEITVELSEPGFKSMNTELDLQVEGETLTIQTSKPKVFFDINLFDGSSKLKIYLPEKMYQSLLVTIDNGGLELNDLSIDKIQADLRNGNVIFENTTSDTITINTENGNVHFANVEGKITGQSDNGNLYVQTQNLDRSIDWEIKNGNITIETETEPTNTVLDVQTKNGRISVFDHADWNMITGAGEHVIKLRVNNGDIKIRK